MMTEKLKELNNQLNEKIDDINTKKNINSNSSITHIRDEVEDIERKILEAKLLKIEIKAFQYITNNNLNVKQDIKTLQRLLRYIERTHERRRTTDCMIERVENLLERRPFRILCQ